jgi:hypothetical protein
MADPARVTNKDKRAWAAYQTTVTIDPALAPDVDMRAWAAQFLEAWNKPRPTSQSAK